MRNHVITAVMTPAAIAPISPIPASVIPCSRSKCAWIWTSSRRSSSAAVESSIPGLNGKKKQVSSRSLKNSEQLICGFSKNRLSSQTPWWHLKFFSLRAHSWNPVWVIDSRRSFSTVNCHVRSSIPTPIRTCEGPKVTAKKWQLRQLLSAGLLSFIRQEYIASRTNFERPSTPPRSAAARTFHTTATRNLSDLAAATTDRHSCRLPVAMSFACRLVGSGFSLQVPIFPALTRTLASHQKPEPSCGTHRFDSRLSRT